jgi:hypothetical protein
MNFGKPANDGVWAPGKKVAWLCLSMTFLPREQFINLDIIYQELFFNIWEKTGRRKRKNTDLKIVAHMHWRGKTTLDVWNLSSNLNSYMNWVAIYQWLVVTSSFLVFHWTFCRVWKSSIGQWKGSGAKVLSTKTTNLRLILRTLKVNRKRCLSKMSPYLSIHVLTCKNTYIHMNTWMWKKRHDSEMKTEY